MAKAIHNTGSPQNIKVTLYFAYTQYNYHRMLRNQWYITIVELSEFHFLHYATVGYMATIQFAQKSSNNDTVCANVARRAMSKDS